MIYLFLAFMGLSRAVVTISPVYNKFKEAHSEEMTDANFMYVYGISIAFTGLVNFLTYTGIYHIAMELL